MSDLAQPARKRRQGVRRKRRSDSNRPWSQLNLTPPTSNAELASADFFLDVGEYSSTAANMSAAEAATAKLKELQAQLVALAIENDALRSRADQSESETVQQLRRQLAEDREQPVPPAAATVAAPSWTTGRIPRVLARLRRRNTVADQLQDHGGGGGGLSRNSSIAGGLAGSEADMEEAPQDAAAAAATGTLTGEAADGSLSGLVGRSRNWLVTGLLGIMEDMQAPTEAERLAAAGEDQLSARKLKVNCTRFGRNTQPIFACLDGFINLIRWRSPSYTAFILMVYYFALLNNYLLPMILLLCILRLMINYLQYRLNWGVNFNFFAEYEESDNEDASEKERTVGTQVNFVVHVAKKVQNLTGKISDNLEKFKNLVTWRSPQHTQTLLGALTGAFVLSLVVPTTTYLFCVGFYLGIKFFLVDAIFSKYPRLRRKYDSVDRIWRSLPTDQQLGYHQTNKDVEKYILPYSDEEQHCSGESRADRSPLGSDDEEFCQAFALPNMECPLARWKGGKRCAIICKEADRTLPDSLKHGKIFLTRSFLCFERGKDRGKAKRRNIVIPLTMIQAVKKTKPFAWLPLGGLAIEVQIRGMEKPITFGALISRDELFDSLMETARKAQLPWATATASTGTVDSTTAAVSPSDQQMANAATDQELQLPPPDMDLVQAVNQALLSDSDSED